LWKGVPREAGHDRLLLALKGNLRVFRAGRAGRASRPAGARSARSVNRHHDRDDGPAAKISSLSRLCGDLSGTAVMARRSWNERTHARRLRRFLTLSFSPTPRRLVRWRFQLRGFWRALMKPLPDGYPSKDFSVGRVAPSKMGLSLGSITGEPEEADRRQRNLLPYLKFFLQKRLLQERLFPFFGKPFLDRFLGERA
jgi:hypothetical protein